MEQRQVKKGLRVWVTNPAKVPAGQRPFGTVVRIADEFGDTKLPSIAVRFDGDEGQVVGGFEPSDLDFE
jgi:hypothetical protein